MVNDHVINYNKEDFAKKVLEIVSTQKVLKGVMKKHSAFNEQFKKIIRKV